jgi:hypothetical protein
MAPFQIRLLGLKFSDSKPYLAVSLFFPFLSPPFFGSLLRLIAQCTRTKELAKETENTKIDHSSRKFFFFSKLLSWEVFSAEIHTPALLAVIVFLRFFIGYSASSVFFKFLRGRWMCEKCFCPDDWQKRREPERMRWSLFLIED